MLLTLIVFHCLQELMAMQENGPKNLGFFGTRNMGFLHQNLIEVLSYAMVLTVRLVISSQHAVAISCTRSLDGDLIGEERNMTAPLSTSRNINTPLTLCFLPDHDALFAFSRHLQSSTQSAGAAFISSNGSLQRMVLS